MSSPEEDILYLPKVKQKCDSDSDDYSEIGDKVDSKADLSNK